MLVLTVRAVWLLKPGSASSPALFLLGAGTAALGHLHFHRNFRISVNFCEKNLVAILVGIELD